MMDITTLSWGTFFIIGMVLFLVWLVTIRTRIGRLLITRETPWTISQWSRILIVLLLTCFILVNPLFHLLTLAILSVLYYVIVANNFMGRNLIDIKGNGEGLNFLSINKDRIKLMCTASNDIAQTDQKYALERCLFSFPLLVGEEPKVIYNGNSYHVEFDLSSEKYTSSLISYLNRNGFDVKKIETNE